MPPPEPRPGTRAPARNSATASGFPHPRLAASASGGSSHCVSALYHTLIAANIIGTMPGTKTS